MPDRKFILKHEGKNIDLTRARAYALESSGYIIPDVSTEEIWNFKLAPGFTDADLRQVLGMFDGAREMFGEYIDED